MEKRSPEFSPNPLIPDCSSAGCFEAGSDAAVGYRVNVLADQDGGWDQRNRARGFPGEDGRLTTFLVEGAELRLIEACTGENPVILHQRRWNGTKIRSLHCPQFLSGLGVIAEHAVGTAAD